MKSFNIGDGGLIYLEKLIDSRLLIQANSGGGKSYLLRAIAEQTAGEVQTIILDPEGEFATLREAFDFVLVGSSGEIAADPRTAPLLARKLLELQASAVIDLYDLKLPERRRFVASFLESLMSLPKSLWRQLIVMIDEAHVFCPERSAGESVATGPIIDLMSQGRKRGYCGILATQRLSKLHKDAEAETNNVFIGRTWLDIDQQRAGSLLGCSKESRLALRDLKPGHFEAFGPALDGAGVRTVAVDKVRTTHPKAGQRHKLTPPKPSDAVKRIVADLADLPAEAEAEIKDLAAAKKRIGELERTIRDQPANAEDVAASVADAIKQGDERFRQFVAAFADGMTGIIAAHLDAQDKSGDKLLDDLRAHFKSNPTTIAPRDPMEWGLQFEAMGKPAGSWKDASAGVPIERLRGVYSRHKIDVCNGQVSTAVRSDGDSAPRRILAALAQYGSFQTYRKIAILAGIKRSGSTWRGAMAKLKREGLINAGSEGATMTAAGAESLGDYESLPTGASLIAYWLDRIGRTSAPGRVLAAVWSATHPTAAGAIAELAGVEHGGSTWRGAMAKLRGLELIEGRDTLQLSEALRNG